ncbi:endo-1,3(4)-beta-glucanase [Panaeolus papilionaceus]|nr:endo-1,3(4)-beta-glucanase [Panaeolus papilionaceus]
MKSIICSSLLLLASLTLVQGNAYHLSDEIIGRDFFDAFEWEAIPDPTHGRVNYVDQPTSRSQNLTYAFDDTFILRTDFTTVLDPNGPGRNSVRIRTKKTYTTHAAVFDIRHMPQGCATWPAVWETDEAAWPNGGETDILEGVNDQSPNAATLHTSTGCTMPASRLQTGTAGQNDCDVAVNFNTGCTVKFATANSYGPSFNANGGGWYAIERTPEHISVWFFPRGGDTPGDIRAGAHAVNPASWGTPSAFFPNTSCNFPQFFDAHNIIINLTLCGDFAGAVYQQDGCPGTCVDLVNNNPAAFQDAFFNFASIRVYT